MARYKLETHPELKKKLPLMEDERQSPAHERRGFHMLDSINNQYHPPSQPPRPKHDTQHGRIPPPPIPLPHSTHSHGRLPRFLKDIADARPARPIGGPVQVVHTAGSDEVVVRRVLAHGDLDRLHLGELPDFRRGGQQHNTSGVGAEEPLEAKASTKRRAEQFRYGYA